MTGFRRPVPMSLHLYNSLSRRVEPFLPADPACPTLYVCGPTVYNYVHIGNARGPVVFDVLAALLRRRFGALGSASVVAFLASDMAGYMSGAALLVDGGAFANFQ